MLALIFSTGGKVYFTGGKGTFCTKTKKFEEVVISHSSADSKNLATSFLDHRYLNGLGPDHSMSLYILLTGCTT